MSQATQALKVVHGPADGSPKRPWMQVPIGHIAAARPRPWERVKPDNTCADVSPKLNRENAVAELRALLRVAS